MRRKRSKNKACQSGTCANFQNNVLTTFQEAQVAGCSRPSNCISRLNSNCSWADQLATPIGIDLAWFMTLRSTESTEKWVGAAPQGLDSGRCIAVLLMSAEPFLELLSPHARPKLEVFDVKTCLL